jgi:hypothetical protein
MPSAHKYKNSIQICICKEYKYIEKIQFVSVFFGRSGRVTEFMNKTWTIEAWQVGNAIDV